MKSSAVAVAVAAAACESSEPERNEEEAQRTTTSVSQQQALFVRSFARSVGELKSHGDGSGSRRRWKMSFSCWSARLANGERPTAARDELLDARECNRMLLLPS